MKVRIILFFVLIVSFNVKAQFSGTPPGNIYYNAGGNVGIGTNNPWDKLHINGILGVGTFSNDPHSGLQIQYTDDGSGTTVFKHQRWGGNFYFKRNDATGEKTQLFFGGAGNHYMDIYNNNNEVKIRFNSGANSYFNGGRLGVGTDDPWETLHINGSLGIGKFSNNPHAGLQIQYTEDNNGGGNTVFKHQRWAGGFYFKRNDASGEKTQFFFGGAGNHYMDIYNNNNEVKIRFTSGGDSYLTGGNLGIGTDTPDAKLAVKGDIHTKEVRVDVLGSMVGDYVFEKDYNLISLPELETYLEQNKHLPEVPSAKEFEAEGMKLKEMNLLLLKKVEELTLYVIDQQKRIIKLENQNNK